MNVNPVPVYSLKTRYFKSSLFVSFVLHLLSRCSSYVVMSLIAESPNTLGVRRSTRHLMLQLMLEFLKDPFLVLHFSCYTLMAFLTMLSVILLSMLMILLFILSVTRHLICGNNLNWLPNLNLNLKRHCGLG